jgi:hypothetical protein
MIAGITLSARVFPFSDVRIGEPAMSSFMGESPADLHEAIASGNPSAIAQSMKRLDFTLIEEWDDDVEMEDGAKGAMILEVDGYPALLAFTSQQCAGDFVAAMPDLVGDDGTAPGFVVGGDSLFEYLPDGYGLILNPETEKECEVLSPDLAAQIKRFIAAP